MKRLALLEIKDGDFNQGFHVALQILEFNSLSSRKITGSLPEKTEFEGLYISWQTNFRRLRLSYSDEHSYQRGNYDDWQIDDTVVTNRSTSEGVAACSKFVNLLESSIQQWLDASPQQDKNFGWIREQLAVEFNNNSDPIPVIISTDNPLMWKLNWYAWDLLENNLNVGISFFIPQNQKSTVKYKPINPKNKIRILAVFGEDKNINLQSDWQEINKLTAKGAEVYPLIKPTAQQLIEALTDKQGWDIFFFAGHSDTQINTELIYINENQSLAIEQFKNALREARDLGLQISIFNSCKGLGIATKLATLQVPVIIVMQDVVPDIIAQSFLKEFLEEYANGETLHTAVRRAQSRLEKFIELPGATWLPVIFQSDISIPPSWQDFFIPSQENNLQPFQYISNKSLIKRKKVNFWMIISLSIITSLLLIGIRTAGILESLELWAYDSFMLLKPIPALDTRILIVGVDNHDVDPKNFDKPLKDRTIIQALTKLEKYETRVIGLDIERDEPTYTQADWEKLGQHIQNSSFPIIAICIVGDLHKNYQPLPSKPPPPGISSARIAFSDVLMLDSNVYPHNNYVRRYSLAMDYRSESLCKTNQSFSFSLVKHYLALQHFQYQSNPGLNLSMQTDKKIISINVLKPNSGGYNRPRDEMLGYQIFINYRRDHRVAQEISLTQLMTSSDADLYKLIHDRIIIIGYVSNNTIDIHQTPVGKMYGVRLHAHVISQLLNALEQNVHLLSYWPEKLENLWIILWGIAGGLLIRFFYLPKQVLLFLLTYNFALVTVGFIYFINNVWIPVIPSILGSLLISLEIYIFYIK